MKIKEQILSLINQKELTVIEIAKHLKTNTTNKKRLVTVYLAKMQKQHLIHVNKNYRPYKYKAQKLEPMEVNILKKMIPEFIKHHIEVDLSENEIKKVKQLHAQI